MGSIVFVHGTGVRLKNYKSGFQKAKDVASTAGLNAIFIECAWGDPLGVEFEGHSLPEPPSQQQLQREAEDFARWEWRFADPLFELNQLTIRDPNAPVQGTPRPGVKPEWFELWESIRAYKPSLELSLLLKRGSVQDYWEDAWNTIVTSPIPADAFKASAHELAEASHALARAAIAQLHETSVAKGASGPSAHLREDLFNRLLADWKQEVYGLGTFFSELFQRVVTNTVRKHRNNLTDSISLPVGDILLYQARGAEVRSFIAEKIKGAEPPVTVVAHSLGGIACVDLLALPDPPTVAHLVTVGSQAPLLNEIGALFSLNRGQQLPDGFPPWLNLYDRNDFLSYVGKRIWPEVEDVEIKSGQPFPDSHSAYFTNELTWKAIWDFTQQ